MKVENKKILMLLPLITFVILEGISGFWAEQLARLSFYCNGVNDRIVEFAEREPGDD
jgi:hypothetical protein